MAVTSRFCKLPWRVSVSLMLSVVLLSGCPSQARQQPSGSVTLEFQYGGKPITEGAVQLVIEGSPNGAFGPVDSNGVVTFPAVPTGTYTVVVMPPAEELPDPEKPSVQKSYDNIPVKFRSVTTSPLKVDVGAKEKKESFDLKK